MLSKLLSYLVGFFDSDDDCDLDQDTEISIPEMISETDLGDEFSTFSEQNLLIHGNTSESDQMRFGQSSEIQQYEDLLSRAKSVVDTDRRLLNTEQAEVDDAHFRLNSLFDQINHEPNEGLAHSYQNEMLSVETELSSHQQKLEQARADLAVHQQAEFDLEDKLREALNKEN